MTKGTIYLTASAGIAEVYDSVACEAALGQFFGQRGHYELNLVVTFDSFAAPNRPGHL